jgi:hypothetical protein
MAAEHAMRESRRRTRTARAGAAILAALAAAPGLARAADHSWTGQGAPGSGSWSNPANWSGGTAPADGESIGALSFPELTDPACAANPATATCGSGANDRTGLTVGTLALALASPADNGPVYNLSGNAITLMGGLSASTGDAARHLSSPASFELPIILGAPQTWTVSGYPPIGSPPSFYPATLFLGPFNGAGDALTLDLSNDVSLILSGDNEVGPLSIVGTDPTRSGFGGAFLNGSVALVPLPSVSSPARLNAADGNPITVTHAQFEVSGDVGPLIARGGELTFGVAQGPHVVTAAGVALDAASGASFGIGGSGDVAGTDYGRLDSSGDVALGGANLSVSVGGSPCATPAMGTVYTLVSTTGTLTGTFDVADGADLTPGYAIPSCDQPKFDLQIAYHESGSPQTVTATVVPAPPPGVAPGVGGAAPVSGTVLVRRRGRAGFTRLRRAELIPSGSELDTTRGRVRLFAATHARRGTEAAELYSGRFRFLQKGRARPTFALSQPLDGCRSARASAATRRPRRHRRRYVWVSERNGRFDTKARYVSTSVQGTTWLTGDTCTSSLVRVTRGVVRVRDHVHHRTVELRAGQRLTVRRRAG